MTYAARSVAMARQELSESCSGERHREHVFTSDWSASDFTSTML